MALNAKTGQPDPGFGKDGEITMDVPFAEVPTIYKDVDHCRSERVRPGRNESSIRRTRWRPEFPATRARTTLAPAKKLWDFHAIAQPGEKGHDTWGDDSWKGRGGTNVWSMTVTVDEKRGIVYMPFGGPAANYYGGDRPGDNLFSNTLVAADANTGKLKWYFQTVHHELWDFDLPPEPVLMDVMHDGKKVPALVQTGKIGYVFVFDRVTGKPVFPIEERPVPKGDAPGEQYSPTQPFPVKPPPVARVTISREDIVTADDTTPEHAKACQELWDKSNFYNAGPYTPWVVHNSPADTKLTLIFPGATGGANWGGAASDPHMGYLFVNMQNAGSTGYLEKNPKYNAETKGTEVEYHRGTGSRKPVRRVQRTRERRERQSDRQLAVPETTVGKPVRRQHQRRARSPGRCRWESPKNFPRRSSTPAVPARSRVRLQLGVVSSLSGRRTTTGSAPSIRKAARSCGPPSSGTRRRPYRSPIRARTASSTWPSWPRAAERAAIRP